MNTDRLVDDDLADLIFVHEGTFLHCELRVLCESILPCISQLDGTRRVWAE
jgi:hypothetical protein